MPRIPYIHLALYTDDTALLTQSWRVDTIVRRLSIAVTRLKQYFTRWRLQVNTSKTEAIFFTNRRPIPPAALCIESLEIPWSTDVKYLGLHLNPTLNLLPYYGPQSGSSCTWIPRKPLSPVSQGFNVVHDNQTSAIPGGYPFYTHVRGPSLVLH
jgi:hypothetical protein